MKRHFMCNALFVVLLFSIPLFSQVKFSGSLRSSFYTFQTLTDTSEIKQLNYYQGLQLRLAPENHSNFYLSTYLRVAKRGDEDWEEKVYNLYADWKAPKKPFSLRLGRQFLYYGVINGTSDGVLVSGSPYKNLNIKLFGGLAAPPARDFDVLKWDEGNVLGGYASYRFPWEFKLDLSYFQKSRNKETVWQLVGAGLSGKLRENIYYQAQLDHNLNTEEIQGMRYRLNYLYHKWTLSAEYNSQRPRVYEDSYFRIFKLDAYNQFRGGVTYNLNQYQLGVQYLFTAVEYDETNQVIVTGGLPWGIVGLVYQDGFGGKNTGLYGELRYDVFKQLTVRAFSSHYNYERQTTVISEDATSVSGGLDYRPFKYLTLQADVQQSINSIYEDDIRGLFRLNYFFGN
jgi:hypothetical protein